MIVVAQLEVMANRLMDVVALGPGRGESRTVLVAMNQWCELHDKPTQASSASSADMFDNTGSLGIMSLPPASQGSSTDSTNTNSLVLLNHE